MMDFDKIEGLVKDKDARVDSAVARRIIDRAGGGGEGGGASGLTLPDAAALLSIEDKGLLKALYRKAGELKERLFGRRVVMFAPLYLSNYCTNGCVYCGFRSANKTAARTALSTGEVVREAKALTAMGFKRVLLVTGEDPRWGLEYIIASVRAIYENTGIRIVHVNAPPMGVEALRELRAAGVGVFQVFQETYHRDTFKIMHPYGRKSDFDYRLSVMDRAFDAGFRDVGIGPLLGLHDYRFECLATIAHSQSLFERYGAHAHTISVPRLRPAAGAGLKKVPAPVTDQELKKITAVFRLAVPSAGVVVSTREPAGLRSELIHTGASQLSAASRTDPGGYTARAGAGGAGVEQFSTNDHRGLAEVMTSIIEEGLVPSLCTTCYRVGRTGADFTEKTVAGDMEKFCSANAALTLKEFLADYSRNGSREALEKAIALSLNEIKDPRLKKVVREKLKEIERGARDLFF